MFVTKDFGENWTEVGLNTALPAYDLLAPVSQSPIPYNQGIPTNDITALGLPHHRRHPGQHRLVPDRGPDRSHIVYLGSFGGDGYNSEPD